MQTTWYLLSEYDGHVSVTDKMVVAQKYWVTKLQILVVDGDDDHAPTINIYELLINSEFIEIQTDRDG